MAIDLSRRSRIFVAEIVGTAFFVFFATTTASTANSDTLTIATAFGLSLAGGIFIAAPISGGHLNPAISFAMMLAGNLSILDGVGYIVAQLVGAVAGSAIGYGVLGSLGYAGWLSVAPGLSQKHGFVAEIVGTFFLVGTFFNAAVHTSHGLITPTKLNVRSSAPRIIGFTTWAIHLALIPIDGCGVNPARAFGPALINNQFNDHWIFWAGPAVASVCTVVLQYILYGTASAEVIEDEDEVAQTSKPSGVPVV